MLTCRLARSFWKWGMGREPPELEGGSPRESDKWGGEKDTGPSNWYPPVATSEAEAGLLEGLDTSACVYTKHMSDEGHYLYFVAHCTTLWKMRPYSKVCQDHKILTEVQNKVQNYIKKYEIHYLIAT